MFTRAQGILYFYILGLLLSPKMNYEIRRDSTLIHSGTTITFNEPHWVIYYSEKGQEGPYGRYFSTHMKALKFLLDGIGASEGISKLTLETNT